MDSNLKQKLLNIKKLITSNQHQQALDQCQVLIYKHSKVYQLYLFAGLCYDKLGKLDKAQNSYKQALDIKNDEPNAIKALCDIYGKMGKLDQSVEYIEKIMKVLNRENKEDLIKFQQWMVKLVKIYQKNEDMEKIDILFKDLIQNQEVITEQFAEVAQAYFKTGLTNQCFFLQNFQVMGVNPKTNTHKALNANAKQKLNYVLVQIVRYLNSVRLQFKMSFKDISDAIVEMRQYFPYNSCFLMLFLLDQHCVSHVEYSTLILQQIYYFLQAIYNKEQSTNCYTNIQLLQPQMFAICLKLSYEYLAFFKEFFTLDAYFNAYYERLENDVKQISLQKVREEYLNKIYNFILKQCRQINRMAQTQNIESRLQKLKSRIIKLNGSYLEQVMAKMAMNTFYSYQKLNDMKNMLKVRLKNSRIKQGLDKNSQVLNTQQNMQKKNQSQQVVAPQPHLYKYYYDYLLKIARIYRALDQQYHLSQILKYIVVNDPNDHKYILQQIWHNFSLECIVQNSKNLQKSKEVLNSINQLEPEVFGSLKSTLLRRKTLLQMYLGQGQSILDGLKLALGTDRSFSNLLSIGTYYFQRQNYQRALNFLKEAFIMDQTHYHLNRIIFVSMLKDNQKKDAFTFLQRIYEGFPNVFWVNYCLAINKSNQKQLELANRHLNKALQGFVAGMKRLYKLSYEKTVQKQIQGKNDGNFTLQYMIHQNQSRILYDQMIISEQYIHKIYPIVSNNYFDEDQQLKQIRIETQLGQNYKLLGRNKSAYNHLYSAYNLTQIVRNSHKTLSSEFLLQQILTIKEFGTAIFYMKFYNQSEAYFKKALELINSYKCEEINKQFINCIIYEIQALSFEVSVKKLEQLMKFESFQSVREYIQTIQKSQLLTKAIKTVQPKRFSLNFLKSKYQYQILRYLHKKAGQKTDKNAQQISNQRCLEAINQFLAYFNVTVDAVGTDQFYNNLVTLEIRDRELLMEGFEDYCIVSVICSKYSTKDSLINTDFVIQLIQVFPKSTIFYIVYGVLTENNKQKISAFLKCIQMDKDSPISVDLLACLYLKQSDYVTACSLFLKSLQIDLFSPKSYIGLCTCLFSLVIQSIGDNKPNQNVIQNQQQLIRKCLNKIKSYMQFLRIVEPSQNYQLFRFLKLLVTDEALDVFQAKTSLQHIHKTLSLKYKNNLLYEMLGDIVWWNTQNIWQSVCKNNKQNALKVIMNKYFINEKLIEQNKQGERDIAINILKRVDRDSSDSKLSSLANKQYRIKTKCLMLNKVLIALGLYIKVGKLQQNQYNLITDIADRLSQKEQDTDQQLRNLQKKCKQSLIHCFIISQTNQNQVLKDQMFVKLKKINMHEIYRLIPTYNHIQTLFTIANNFTEGDTITNHKIYEQSLKKIKKYLIYCLHLHPTDTLLRKTLLSYLMSVDKLHSLNYKLHKNTTYRFQILNSLNSQKNAYQQQNLQRIYKKNILLYNDAQSWVSFITIKWQKQSNNKHQLTLKWKHILQKIVSDCKTQKIKLTPLAQFKAESILEQMYVELKDKSQLTVYSKAIKQVLIIANSNCQPDILDLKIISQLSQRQQDQILISLCAILQKKYINNKLLLQIFDKCIELYSHRQDKKYTGYFKLLKFLAIVEICHQLANQQPTDVEAQFLEYIKEIYMIIQSATAQRQIHPNTLAFMKCIGSLLTVDNQQLQQELNNSMDNCKFITSHDQFLINYFEIMRAFKEVEIEGQSSFQNFAMYVDQMIKITKEPFYKGFLYMLKAMARLMIQQEQINSTSLRQTKMAKLLDPRAAQHLFNQ